MPLIWSRSWAGLIAELIDAEIEQSSTVSSEFEPHPTKTDTENNDAKETAMI